MNLDRITDTLDAAGAELRRSALLLGQRQIDTENILNAEDMTRAIDALLVRCEQLGDMDAVAASLADARNEALDAARGQFIAGCTAY